MLDVQIAKRQAVVNPENTFFSVKRFVGRRMSEVTEECKQVPYVVSGWCPALLTAAARVWVHACICMLVAMGQTSSRSLTHPALPAQFINQFCYIIAASPVVVRAFLGRLPLWDSTRPVFLVMPAIPAACRSRHVSTAVVCSVHCSTPPPPAQHLLGLFPLATDAHDYGGPRGVVPQRGSAAEQ
jgi:hypothetical protein